MLSDRFARHLPAHGEAYRAVPGLEAVLEALAARAQAAWPMLGVTAGELIEHLAARLPPARDAARALAAVAAEDLCLALACAKGSRAAMEALETHQLPAVARAVASLDQTGVLADEVKQLLRERLLMPRPGGAAPRIADYAGQGPLRAWLKAAAIRHALNLKRPGQHEEAVDSERLAALPLAAPDAELALIRKRHQAHFADAFTAALATLTPRERTLLKLHTLDRLPLDRIAPVYGKDKSTISRWLAKAQAQLEAETRAHLRRVLELNSQELESVLRAAQSELSLSLSRLLNE